MPLDLRMRGTKRRGDPTQGTEHKQSRKLGKGVGVLNIKERGNLTRGTEHKKKMRPLSKTGQ
jgi:hypothetical protein